MMKAKRTPPTCEAFAAHRSAVQSAPQTALAHTRHTSRAPIGRAHTYLSAQRHASSVVHTWALLPGRGRSTPSPSQTRPPVTSHRTDRAPHGHNAPLLPPRHQSIHTHAPSHHLNIRLHGAHVRRASCTSNHTSFLVPSAAPCSQTAALTDPLPAGHVCASYGHTHTSARRARAREPPGELTPRATCPSRATPPPQPPYTETPAEPAGLPCCRPEISKATDTLRLML